MKTTSLLGAENRICILPLVRRVIGWIFRQSVPKLKLNEVPAERNVNRGAPAHVFKDGRKNIPVADGVSVNKNSAESAFFERVVANPSAISVRRANSSASSAPSLTESHENQSEANKDYRYTYEASFAHGASPSSHDPLRFKIVLVALLWTCSLASLCLTILARKAEDGTFEQALFLSGVCVICGSLLSYDLIMSLS